MLRHIDREIERLKKHLLALSAVVEESVQGAIDCLDTPDAAAAARLIDGDEAIDMAEVDIEEDCLKILALHQPVAIDLRFVIAVLKINNDLERVGDEAVNIAERALFLAQHPPIDLEIFDYSEMAAKAQAMLHHSLDALVTLDARLARAVGAADDEVDALNRQMYEQVQQAMRRHPEQAEALVHYLSISRHLERIADYATNIAEDVVYMIEGEVVRHKPEVFLAAEE
jgi:phosphate transport system protein